MNPFKTLFRTTLFALGSYVVSASATGGDTADEHTLYGPESQKAFIGPADNFTAICR